MAYMSQENKKMIAPQIKSVLKKYGMKGSISVNHHSTLVVTLKEGELDIITNLIATGKTNWATEESAPEYLDVNTHWLDDHYTGEVLNFLKELKAAMNGEGSEGEQNFDKSDIMTDYFHVGWYITISVGKWDKPYVCTQKRDIEKKKQSFDTKIAHAVAVYKGCEIGGIVRRQDIITALASSMEITRVQAAGYYQNAKKKLAA